MAYWLDLFTPDTWARFQDHGATISGFRPRERKTAFARVNKGDKFLCYLARLSRWCGVLEVSSDAFEDTTPIFAEDNDPFPIRFKVTPKLMLNFECSVPIEVPELWYNLSFTKGLIPRSPGWAQPARMRQSLLQIPDPDGDLICQILEQQHGNKHIYDLDAEDRRHIAHRTTTIKTETGEVNVEVPDREEIEPEPVELEREVKESIKMQADVAKLGIILGFNIWVPPSDRGRVFGVLPAAFHSKLIKTLPLNYNDTTLQTIENIDVIWLDRRSIAHAFEIEHTTTIYSGLLRMADLLALQPRIQISLHIVAPTSRRDQVRREIMRPVFAVLEGGPMAEKCSFISYDALDEILQQPNLRHARETILEEYEEVFDAL